MRPVTVWKRLNTVRRSVLAAAGAGMLVACGTTGSVSPGVSPELKHSWEINFNRGDAAAVAALYAPDAQLVMSGSEPPRGPRPSARSSSP